jgi:heme/copper-type cytochrome/quinol oxidase subunit 3
LYYPYVVCALIIAKERVSKSLLIAAPGATAGFVAFVAAVRHPGNLRTAIAICNSLGEHELAAEPCSGAIVYMSRGAAMARQDVLTAIVYWHLKVVMPFLLIMSLGPIMLGMIALWRRQQERRLVSVVATSLCVAWLGTVPLFIYGFDWNRWIYVHVFSSLLLMLFLERKWQKRHPMVQQPLFTKNGRLRIVWIVMLIISSCGWQLGVYHHFPLPGDTLMVYLRKRIRGQPLHNKLDWRPPGS